MINYSICGPYAAIVQAHAIVESNERPEATGDGGQARGLVQLHPAEFRQFYGRSARFPATDCDTWIEADLKTCATFHEHYEGDMPLDLRVQGWNVGVQALLRGQRNPEYLAKWTEAYQRVRQP